jgi:hypothetical protein
MSAEVLLARLDKVRPRGPGRWSARCPSHNDKGPSLSIAEKPGGVVLVHCFAGCEAGQVIDAAGLDMSVLFPPKDSHASPAKKRGLLAPSQALEILRDESQVVAVCAANIGHGIDPTPQDRERCLSAAGRITYLHGEANS